MRRISLALVVGTILLLVAAMACGTAPTPQAPPAHRHHRLRHPHRRLRHRQHHKHRSSRAAPAMPAPAAPAAPAAAPQAFSPAPPTGRTVATPVRREAMMEAPETGPKQGGILRWTPQASVANLDPTRQTSFVTHSIVYQWYDYPFGWNLDRVAQEQMVDSWSVND